MIIAVVGMPGSGKTEATKVIENMGFTRVYFGDIVFDEMKKENIEINEENERKMRERLRKDHGMEMAAKLSIPKIENGLKKGNVVIESLYSWEEYLYLKNKYKDTFKVLAIYALPKTRYKRLTQRQNRPLTMKECKQRDKAQLENLHTGGPIAMANHTIRNNKTLKEFRTNIKGLINSLT